jgi:hypothetical protein
VKGDRVEILIDVGDNVERFDIYATRAGRRVEIANVRGTVEVTEVTRTGQPVRSARFMATRVVAVVEHPAADRQDSEGTLGKRSRKAIEEPSTPLF